jgi:DnaJ family protein C protein 28
MSNESETPTPTDSDPASGDDHRRRMRFQWNDLMEDLIEDGRRRGLFEDLPGKGKPLDLEQNIYEGSSALANQLMKTNDIKPVWLSQRIGVSEKIDELRVEMRRTWTRYRASFEQSQGETHRQALSLGWDDVCRRWQESIEKLNKEIATYNLKRPNGQMELFKLRLDDELKRIDAPRRLI